MTAAVLKDTSAPLLNRLRGWELIALGLSGWVTLYSSAVLNFQRNIAEVAGHTQGLCFAVAMALGGAEARKRRQEDRRKLSLRKALAWTEDMPEHVFIDQLGRRFEAQDYRLEEVYERERSLGYCLRVVRRGRTTLIYGKLWREDTLAGDAILQLPVGPANAVCADRILVLTKAEVSPAVRAQMPAKWQVISGAEFLAFAKEFPIFNTAYQPAPLAS